MKTERRQVGGGRPASKCNRGPGEHLLGDPPLDKSCNEPEHTESCGGRGGGNGAAGGSTHPATAGHLYSQAPLNILFLPQITSTLTQVCTLHCQNIKTSDIYRSALRRIQPDFPGTLHKGRKGRCKTAMAMRGGWGHEHTAGVCVDRESGG